MPLTSEKFERIEQTPAYQLVADAIEREIVSGRIRPGEAIGSEVTLAKQFQVNRATVREGIRLLEEGGLIQRDSRRRLFAGFPHYNRMATRISRALMLHEVTFRELFDAALCFETSNIELAVAHATAEELEKIDANIDRTERASGDPAAIAALDAEFHELVARLAKNRVLLLAGEPLNLLIFPTTELILQRDCDAGLQRMVQAHRMYVDAIRRRDVAAARQWVSRHLSDWRRGFELAGKELDKPVDYVYSKHRSRNGENF
jgi:GntR family transcriptional regulator, transcriptional repressor for pyruvate dehydrogenase complex